MKIKAFLLPDCVTVDVRASDKNRLLRELAQRAAAMLGLPAEEISALASNRQNLDLLARVVAHKCLGRLDEVCIKRATQTFISGN